MMEYENDFVTEKSIDLKIEGYPEGSWIYMPTTAGLENSWLEKYMVYDPETKSTKQDYAMLNKLKMARLIKVPYDQEMIKKMTGIDQAWVHLNEDQKWSVLEKLKPSIFDKILLAINAYDKGETVEKKT